MNDEKAGWYWCLYFTGSDRDPVYPQWSDLDPVYPQWSDPVYPQ
jgi:hypothetical protein